MAQKSITEYHGKRFLFDHWAKQGVPGTPFCFLSPSPRRTRGHLRRSSSHGSSTVPRALGDGGGCVFFARALTRPAAFADPAINLVAQVQMTDRSVPFNYRKVAAEHPWLESTKLVVKPDQVCCGAHRVVARLTRPLAREETRRIGPGEAQPDVG